MMTGRPNNRSITFAIPAGAGDYAPEVLYLAPSNDPKSGLDCVDEVQGFVRSLPADATIEMDLLKPGGTGDPTVDTSWNLDASSDPANATGPFGLLKLGGWKGVRFRGKSGGTGGNSVLDLSWVAKH
jgi:hypothetical protein